MRREERSFLWKPSGPAGAEWMWHVAWSAVSCVHLTPADFLGCGRGLSSIQHISYPALGQLYFPLCGFVSDVRLSDTINLCSQRLSSICSKQSWQLPNSSFLYFVRSILFTYTLRHMNLPELGPGHGHVFITCTHREMLIPMFALHWEWDSRLFHPFHHSCMKSESAFC